ncbi:hypothetical protein MTO96_004053 [Rhipicephalus appendiculatus]
MELLSEFGDPQVLSLAEDHIALKLETPWPRDVVLPEGLSLENDDGLLLVANRKSLISAATSALPRGVRISKALFCGCASFEASERYRSAASQLLRDTHEICIMHNRDKVYNLVRMFPNVKDPRPTARSQLAPHLGTGRAMQEPRLHRWSREVRLKELLGNSGRDFNLHLSPRDYAGTLAYLP